MAENYFPLTQTGQQTQALLDKIAAMPDASAVATTEGTDLKLQVLVEAVAALTADIQGLDTSLQNLGQAKAISFDAENGYMICGSPIFAVTDGAPSEPPVAVGLFRLDRNTGALYVSKDVTDSTADWQIIS